MAPMQPQARMHPSATVTKPQGGEVDEQGIDDAVDILEDGQEAAAGGGAQRERITTKYMTKYERARVLGTRALQIRYAGMHRVL
jgi:hypothetical protein